MAATARHRHRLLNLVQLVLAPYILGSDFTPPPVDYAGIQRVVYSRVTTNPITHGLTGTPLRVNDAWLVEVLNFFKIHLSRKNFYTLYPSFAKLDRERLVRRFDRHLGSETNGLGKRWLFTTSSISVKNFQAAIDQAPFGGPLSDEMLPGIGEDFGELVFTISEHPRVSWNATFEFCVPALPSRASDPDALRAQSKRFDIDGNDNIEGNEDKNVFEATGWLNPLPPQMGISGWQRVVMVRYDTDVETSEQIPVFQYEGVVLPGGQMMLGRASLAREILNPDYLPPPGVFLAWIANDAQALEEEAMEEKLMEEEAIEEETTVEEAMEEEATEEATEDEAMEDEATEDEATEDEAMEEETMEDEATEDEAVEETIE
ncbi:MAG: hypothetical protein Q9157_004965 [Trypethelium eluteriae]